MSENNTPEQQQASTLRKVGEETANATLFGTGTVLTVAGLKTAAAAATPWMMSTFATVVPGVGSFHCAGVAAVQSFAMTPTPLAVPALTGIAGYYSYKLYRHYSTQEQKLAQ